MTGVDITALLQQFGLAAMFAGVALESTGLPVPGETLLVLTTVSAAHVGAVGFWQVFAVAAAAAVVGDNVGYLLGRFGGWPLVRRYGRFVGLSQSKLKVARYLFARHGGKVVFGGRFVAVLRTTSALLAGVNHMPWRRFLICNAAGGLLWAGAWTALAYVLGSHVEHLPGPAAWGVAAAAAVGVLAGVLVIRRRWRRLARTAELAYPGPL